MNVEHNSFKAVFGQVYDHPLACSNREAYWCWTVDDRMKVTNKPHFKDYVRETYFTEDDQDDEEK